jgi:sterol desaturase/sphingolipid hydroxylase (fatty acid hydroxylase superfamily)
MRLLLLSTYSIFTLFNIHISFPIIVLFELSFFSLLAIFLDYLAPTYCSITYFDNNDFTNQINKITPLTVINIVINLIIYYISKYIVYLYQYSPIITIVEITIRLIIGGILSSVFFYYTHKLLHHKLLYGPIHKQHHIFNNPLSVVSIYGHHIEFILSNCTSLFLAPYLAGLSTNLIMSYSFLGLTNVIVTHTSYKFDNSILDLFFGNSYFHYIHHAKFNYNYGLNSKFMDMIHGTKFMEKIDK